MTELPANFSQMGRKYSEFLGAEKLVGKPGCLQFPWSAEFPYAEATSKAPAATGSCAISTDMAGQVSLQKDWECVNLYSI